MLCLKYKIMLKPFFPSLPDVIFRQLDNEYENDRQEQITVMRKERNFTYKTNSVPSARVEAKITNDKD